MHVFTYLQSPLHNANRFKTLISSDFKRHHRSPSNAQGTLGVYLDNGYLEGDVKLVWVVDSDDPLVGGLVLEVEVQLDGEDEYGHLAVQDGGRGGGAH